MTLDTRKFNQLRQEAAALGLDLEYQEGKNKPFTITNNDTATSKKTYAQVEKYLERYYRENSLVAA